MIHFKVDKFIGNNSATLSSQNASIEPELILQIDGQTILHAYEANTFFSRLHGLHKHLPIADDHALVITHCKAIHTIGMPSAIDCIFVDSDGQVLKVQTVSVRRWASCSGAAAVVETNAGVCARLGITRGLYIGRETGDWT